MKYYVIPATKMAELIDKGLEVANKKGDLDTLIDQAKINAQIALLNASKTIVINDATKIIEP